MMMLNGVWCAYAHLFLIEHVASVFNQLAKKLVSYTHPLSRKQAVYFDLPANTLVSNVM